MNKLAKKCLSDILHSITLIEEFVKDTPDFADYQADEKTKNAVERRLTVIGEAVNNFRQEEPIFMLSKARQIVKFRNRLIHAYFSMDDTTVWAIVKNELPGLKLEVEQGLQIP